MVQVKGLFSSILILVLFCMLFVLVISDSCMASSAHEAVAHHGSDIGKVLPIWSIIPFVGILLSIAVLPLIAPHIWHAHFGKISAFWALPLRFPFFLFIIL